MAADESSTFTVPSTTIPMPTASPDYCTCSRCPCCGKVVAPPVYYRPSYPWWAPYPSFIVGTTGSTDGQG